MFMAHDVIVVGGGLIGMITARTLRLAGLDVVLLEKNRLGKQASWAAGGILAKQHPWQQSEGMRKLIHAGQAAFPGFVAELQDETGVDSQLLQSGMLITNLEQQEAALAWGRKHRMQIELVHRSALAKLEPGLAKTIDAALHVPSAMQVQPRLLIEATRKSLELHGVQILERVTVTGLHAKASRLTGVKTNQGSMHAGQVMLCNGAWARQLLQTLGRGHTDIEPVRGQMLVFKPSRPLLSHILVSADHYLIPRNDLHILCGSTMERVGFDDAVTADARNSIHAQASRLCPQLENEVPVKHWAGLRPGTARDVPYICVHPEFENLYINAGHFRYGIVMSIPSAEIACDLVMDRPSAFQTELYDWLHAGTGPR